MAAAVAVAVAAAMAAAAVAVAAAMAAAAVAVAAVLPVAAVEVVAVLRVSGAALEVAAALELWPAQQVFAALVSVFAAPVSVYIADAHSLDAASAAVVVAAEAVGAAELVGYGHPHGAGSTPAGPNLHLRVKKLASPQSQSDR